MRVDHSSSSSCSAAASLSCCSLAYKSSAALTKILYTALLLLGSCYSFNFVIENLQCLVFYPNGKIHF